MNKLERVTEILGKFVVSKSIMAEATSAIMAMFPRFEQVAFCVPDVDRAIENYKLLGCKEWVRDIVLATGYVGGPDPRAEVFNVAELAFNYDLGVELELIRYRAGHNWHWSRGTIGLERDFTPFLSHMSYHVEDMAGELTKFKDAGFYPIQNVTTISHTNPALVASGRKYQYVVLDTRAAFGFDVKLIKRLEATR